MLVDGKVLLWADEMVVHLDASTVASRASMKDDWRVHMRVASSEFDLVWQWVVVLVRERDGT